MRYEPFDWYATPLYYDIIFDADTGTEADFLAAAYAKYATCAPRGRPVALEPACGSGRLLSAMAQRGFAVYGFDREPAMLAMAKDRLGLLGVRAGPATLKRASFDDFAFGPRVMGRVALGFCLVSSFKYELREDAAREHLRRMADHVMPGGLYVLGLHLSAYGDRRTQRERWTAQRDGIHVVCNISSKPADRKTRTERVRSRLIATHPDGGVRRFESSWDFRTYSKRQLVNLIRSEPRFAHVATHTFHHDIAQTCKLGDEHLGVVLILRRV